MNKKLSSLFISFILLISGLMIFNIETVSAAPGWAATITSQTSTTSYFNSENMSMLFDVKVTITDVNSTNKIYQIRIKAPAGYVLDSTGLQPPPPKIGI